MDPAAILGANLSDPLMVTDLVLGLILAIAFWIVVGIPTVAGTALVGRGNLPLFPVRPDKRRLALRPRIWAVRGGVVGAIVAVIAHFSLVPPTPALSARAYEVGTSFGPWSVLGPVAFGVAIGATIAACVGTHPEAGHLAGRLGAFIPVWLTIAAISAAAVSVVAVVVMAAVDGRAPGSAAVASASAAVISLGILSLGWRYLVARSAHGLDAGWADVARVTALWAWIVLPIVAMLATIDRLLQGRVPRDLPADLGDYEGVVHTATIFSVVSSPVAILLIGCAILLSPHWAVKTRHSEQWATNRAAALLLRHHHGTAHAPH